MSWNLLIYKPGRSDQSGEPLSALEAVTAAFNGAFPNLHWYSPTAAALLVDGGFDLELAVEQGAVQDVYTNGGYNHLREFAALCKQEGWRIADAQEAEDVDLQDPYGWYGRRNA